jgi:hypothetical protein
MTSPATHSMPERLYHHQQQQQQQQQALTDTGAKRGNARDNS